MLQGSDPYQYALLGPTLTITRKFTRSGTNSYTLAPHSGKVTHSCLLSFLWSCCPVACPGRQGARKKN